MNTAAADILPSALDCRNKSAQMEAEKAAANARRLNAGDDEMKKVIDRLSKPSGVTDEERMKRAAVLINRAVSNGLTEVEVTRFPNKMCTDFGRAINQQERGWEETLTGLPKELYQFWKKHLEPRGYRIKCQIADWPNGVPGDVSITVMWK
jgi:uncharacterized protein (DUF1778 family)